MPLENQRGYGLTYTYAFVEGAGTSHKRGSNDGLSFKNNARLDKLVRVLDFVLTGFVHALGEGH